jgi:SAM-dependent methyltransferase
MDTLDPASHDRRCDTCNGRLDVLFPEARDPQTGHLFAVSKCVDCGLGHTIPQPADLGLYYGPLYHCGRHGLTDRMCMARRVGFVRSIGDPTSVLDFGCGDGSFLEAAAAKGWKATGVEIKPEHARTRGIQVVESIEELASTFDVITLWHSLEHVRSPRKTLELLLPRLAEDGHLIIAVPNLASVQAQVFSNRWFHLDVPRHLFHFTPMALERLLVINGLQVVRRWNLEAEFDLFGWTQSILNYAIPSQNVLFDVLTHRGRAHARAEIVASVALGTLVTALAAPLVPFAAAASRGAVMVLAAKRVSCQ